MFLPPTVSDHNNTNWSISFYRICNMGSLLRQSSFAHLILHGHVVNCVRNKGNK